MKSSVINNTTSSLFIGVDAGSSFTKLVVVGFDKKIIAWFIKKSGTNFSTTTNICLKEIMNMVHFNKGDISFTVSTGYGRKNVAYANLYRTEISCHAKGCFYYFPFKIQIVDIGGQDNKIIKINNKGKCITFKMNRKCAAGTGAFLEEMSLKLNISLKTMNIMAASAKNIINLGSYCTVFSATEVLENIRLEKNIKDIVNGLFYSILKRITEMDIFGDKVVLTGGVIANNPYLVKAAKTLISQKILIPQYPQLTGALGAALYAVEMNK